MTERQAILHIGTMKTGSTAIQAALRRSQATMVSQGAYIPKTPGRARLPLLIYTVTQRFGGAAPFLKGEAPETRLERFAKDFAREMAEIPENVDRVIFTDEMLSANFLSVEEVVRFKEILSPWFKRFSVVLYIRRQDQFLASLYVTLLRLGFVETPSSRFSLNAFNKQADYHMVASRWAEAFGRDAMNIRIYESTEKRFDSVADFFSICNLVPPSAQVAAMRRNESIDAVGQAILREVGERLRDDPADLLTVSGQWDKLLGMLQKNHTGKGWLPTQAEAAELVAKYADGNEALRAEYFPQRASLFSTDFSQLPEREVVPDPNQVAKGACTLIAQLLAEVSAPAAKRRPGIHAHRKQQEKQEAIRKRRLAKPGNRKALMAAKPQPS